MTIDQYKSLPLAELRAIAKNRGMKSTTALRKEELIQRMLEQDQMDAEDKDAKSPKPEPTEESEPKVVRKETPPAETQNRQVRRDPERRNYSENRMRQDRRQNEGRNNRQFDRDNNRDNNRRQPAEQPQEPVKPVETVVAAEREASVPEEMSIEEEFAEARPDLSSVSTDGEVRGTLEIPEGVEFGFIRTTNYLKGDEDIYVAPSQIRRFHLATGDQITGIVRTKNDGDSKYAGLMYVKSVNDRRPDEAIKRKKFDSLIPIFPNEKLKMERPDGPLSMRVLDLFCPIGKGQRGMIVSPPKAGKTTLLKDIALSMLYYNPDIYLIVVLIDERPEEVTDFKEAIQGRNVEVVYSTFDNEPDKHKMVAEMALARAKRLVELDEDVVILIDSITRLTRAYNLTCQASGRTLSGGLDPASLHAPKKFFGAARNIRDGGSLTILATALVDTGSKMDDVVYEEFKGTGNMELVLDRKLQERRIFPAIDIAKSGTRRDELLLTKNEIDAAFALRKPLFSQKPEEEMDELLKYMKMTKDNDGLVYSTLSRKISNKK